MSVEKHSDPETGQLEIEENNAVQPVLSRDGRHLNPQPSNDPADPLNWPMALKVIISLRFILNLSANVSKGWRSCASVFARCIGNSQYCHYQPCICSDGKGISHYNSESLISDVSVKVSSRELFLT